jgi:pantoate--beta-alanine ligase
MIVFKKPDALYNFLKQKRKIQTRIGFVPTMGALHAGHLSLIEKSKAQSGFTVCSIFVNPTQFNDPEDFAKYPVTLEKDIYQLEASGCDAVLIPSVQDIYPEGTSVARQYDIGFLETVLEGLYRPGHFQGVCRVMHRLLEIVLPDYLYLGQKDYQQCMVIKKLIELIGVHENIEAVICPTVREPGGLAMSSRNARLNGEERKKASAVSEALQFIKENLVPGDISSFKSKAEQMLEEKGFFIDYIEIADAASLSAVNNWDGKQKLVALAAAFLNKVRLIDNMLIN